MTDDDFADMVAQVHEAALGLAPWSRFGDALRPHLGASRITLRLGPANGATFQDLMQDTPDPARHALDEHYRRLDPSLPFAVAIAGHRLEMKEVAHVFEMIPEPQFRRSEFYADYGRQHAMHHRLGFSGIRGGPVMAPFSAYRAEGAQPFDETHRALILKLKPHIKRALRSHGTPHLGATAVGAGFHALALRAEPIIVANPALHVVYANQAAGHATGTPHAPLRLAPSGATGLALRIPAPAEAARLSRLVRAVALEARPGGTIRLRPPQADTEDPGMLVTIQPLPARLVDAERPSRAHPGLAMLVLSSLRRQPPAEAALVELFGLTQAEAAIATALAAGATAESAAAARNVAVGTVRTQIRTIMAKLGATNLRDVERILALLPRS